MSNFKIIRVLQNYKEDKRVSFRLEGHQYAVYLLQSSTTKIKHFYLEMFLEKIGFDRIISIDYDTIRYDIDFYGSGAIYLNEPLENYDDTELLYHFRQLTDDKIISNPNLLSKIREVLWVLSY